MLCKQFFIIISSSLPDDLILMRNCTKGHRIVEFIVSKHFFTDKVDGW